MCPTFPRMLFRKGLIASSKRAVTLATFVAISFTCSPMLVAAFLVKFVSKNIAFDAKNKVRTSLLVFVQIYLTFPYEIWRFFLKQRTVLSCVVSTDTLWELAAAEVRDRESGGGEEVVGETVCERSVFLMGSKSGVWWLRRLLSYKLTHSHTPRLFVFS